MPLAKDHATTAAALPDSARSAPITSLPIPVKAKVNAHNWDRDVDQRLMDWAQNPNLAADEGIDPPSADALQNAAHLAQRLQALGAPAPDSLSPDPNGGIVFAWREHDALEEYHIWDNGTVE